MDEEEEEQRRDERQSEVLSLRFTAKVLFLFLLCSYFYTLDSSFSQFCSSLLNLFYFEFKSFPEKKDFVCSLESLALLLTVNLFARWRVKMSKLAARRECQKFKAESNFIYYSAPRNYNLAPFLSSTRFPASNTLLGSSRLLIALNMSTPTRDTDVA